MDIPMIRPRTHKQLEDSVTILKHYIEDQKFSPQHVEFQTNDESHTIEFYTGEKEDKRMTLTIINLDLFNAFYVLGKTYNQDLTSPYSDGSNKNFIKNYTSVTKDEKRIIKFEQAYYRNRNMLFGGQKLAITISIQDEENEFKNNVIRLELRVDNPKSEASIYENFYTDTEIDSKIMENGVNQILELIQTYIDRVHDFSKGEI